MSPQIALFGCGYWGKNIADQCLSLPMSACLRVEDQQAVVEAIQS